MFIQICHDTRIPLFINIINDYNYIDIYLYINSKTPLTSEALTCVESILK